MAYYIEVIKTDKEDKNFVYYSYQFSLPSGEFENARGKTRYRSKIVSGSLKINKKNGDVHTFGFAEGDDGNYAKRAGWALMKHWKEGEYPDKTCWAS